MVIIYVYGGIKIWYFFEWYCMIRVFCCRVNYVFLSLLWCILVIKFVVVFIFNFVDLVVVMCVVEKSGNDEELIILY